MSEDNTKLGFSYSVALHLGVTIAAIVSVFVSSLWQKDEIEPPKPFELVEPPPEQPLQENPQPEPAPQITQPKVEDLDPLDLPEPQPEPQPTPPKNEPEPQPEPKAEPKPAPKPKPKPKPAPKKVSYADFIKEIREMGESHSIILIHVFDLMEETLPTGLLSFTDGTARFSLNTRLKKVQQAFTHAFQQRQKTIQEAAKKAHAFYVPLQTQQDYIHHMIQILNKRGLTHGK